MNRIQFIFDLVKKITHDRDSKYESLISGGIRGLKNLPKILDLIQELNQIFMLDQLT